MDTFKSIVVKYLNKAPTAKKILIRVILAKGGFNRLKWIFYQFYFFLSSIQFFLNKSHVVMRKSSAVKSIIFLLPKYIAGRNYFETSEEIVLCFKELYPDIPVECVYFDENEFINDKEACLKHIITANPSHFVYLYGPNPKFELNRYQLQNFLRQLKGYKIIIATDSIRMSHSYFLKKISNDVEMIVGLDAPLRFGSKKSKLIGVLPSMISQHTFEKFIQPNLSIPRDIDVLIAGSKYRKRLVINDFLQKNGLKVEMLGGDYGKKRLSYDEYFLISCRAKIRVLSLFTSDELEIHLKAQIAEVVATASLLFVNSPHLVSIYFDERKEFISYASLEDLLEKVKWYLGHDKERVKVSMAAHRRWIEDYSGGKFWQNIFSKADDADIHQECEF